MENKLNLKPEAFYCDSLGGYVLIDKMEGGVWKGWVATPSLILDGLMAVETKYHPDGKVVNDGFWMLGDLTSEAGNLSMGRGLHEMESYFILFKVFSEKRIKEWGKKIEKEKLRFIPNALHARNREIIENMFDPLGFIVPKRKVEGWINAVVYTDAIALSGPIYGNLNAALNERMLLARDLKLANLSTRHIVYTEGAKIEDVTEE